MFQKYQSNSKDRVYSLKWIDLITVLVILIIFLRGFPVDLWLSLRWYQQTLLIVSVIDLFFRVITFWKK